MTAMLSKVFGRSWEFKNPPRREKIFRLLPDIQDFAKLAFPDSQEK